MSVIARGLDARLPTAAAGTAGGDGVVAQAVPFLQQQHVAGVDPAERHVLSPDRGIGLARHERELVLEQLAHVQVAGIEGQRDQRDVEPARAQPLEQAIREVLAQVQLQLRVRAAQRRKHAGQQVGRDGGDGAEAQRPGQRARRGAGRLRQVRGRGQQLARARDDVLAHRGEPHVALVALDELHVQGVSSSLIPAESVDWVTNCASAAARKFRRPGELDQVGELAQGREAGHQPSPWLNRVTRSL